MNKQRVVKNLSSKDVTAQTQQQRPELATATLTWHASKYKVYELYQGTSLKEWINDWLEECLNQWKTQSRSFCYHSFPFSITSGTFSHTHITLLLSWCFTSTETIRLIRDGRRWGKREIIYLSLHRHYQNDSCIKTVSYTHLTLPTNRLV